MDEQPDKGNEPGPPVPLIAWAICAFVPAVVGIATMRTNNDFNEILQIDVAVNVVFSLAAGFGLCSRIKEPVSRIIGSLFLSGFFFVFNTLVVVFVGCSKMGAFGR